MQRPLEALGVSDSEETVYECLLRHPGATAAEIAGALTQSLNRTQRVLNAIESKGLATHCPERPRRYIPAAPDMAMESLLLRRQEDLQGARSRIQQLKDTAAAHRHSEQEQIIELIVSREAQRQAFDHLRLTAQHEIVCLTRPPMLITPMGPNGGDRLPANPRSLERRCIIDQDYLELPGAIETVRHDLENGEHTRIFPELPLKFVLADHRVALIPLDLGRPDTPSLLVRSSALLDALYALFELLWQHATPVSFTRGGSLKTNAPADEASEDLLAMLAAGLNDKTIAHKSGISLRTLKRRISELMRRHKARTRFQLAWSITQGANANHRINDRKKPHR